ncbi:MAG: tyrosine-type recombinase/integrase [Armatimonadota bacterium]
MPTRVEATRRQTELLAEYVERLDRLNYSPFTVRLYRLALEKLFQTYPDVPLDMLTAEHIERHILARPVSPRSRATEARFLSPFFQWLCDHKRLVPRTPGKDVELPRWVARPRPAPTFADFARLCRVCRTLEEKALVRLYFQTALRLREGLSLRVGDVDLKAREIRLRRGKGGVPRTVMFDPIRMPTRYRLSPVLRRLMADRPADAWLFPGRRGKARSHEWVNSILRRLGREVGLPYRLTAHVLRHGWVRWAKTSGLPIPLAMKQLGHTDIRTTDRAYGAVDAADLRRGIDRYLSPGS